MAIFDGELEKALSISGCRAFGEEGGGALRVPELHGRGEGCVANIWVWLGGEQSGRAFKAAQLGGPKKGRGCGSGRSCQQ